MSLPYIFIEMELKVVAKIEPGASLVISIKSKLRPSAWTTFGAFCFMPYLISSNFDPS